MNDLTKEATDIQAYLDITVSNEPTELTERLSTLMTYMSRSGEMLAQAKKILRTKKTSEINKTIIAIAKQECLSASVQNALLDSICEEESYMVDWLDRINRTCTHQIDGIRSLLSYVKEEMRFGR
jgi:uncharacterized protein with PQ loop repeat